MSLVTLPASLILFAVELAGLLVILLRVMPVHRRAAFVAGAGLLFAMAMDLGALLLDVTAVAQVLWGDALRQGDGSFGVAMLLSALLLPMARACGLGGVLVALWMLAAKIPPAERDAREGGWEADP